jgi:predicted DNA-binding transcriptional regulator YafY
MSHENAKSVPNDPERLLKYMKLISLSIPLNLESGSQSIHATLLDGNVSVPVSISDDHPQWDKAFQLVKDLQSKVIDADAFANQFQETVNLEKAITKNFTRLNGILDGRMTVSSKGVMVDYEPIDSVLESHILRMIKADGTPKNHANWRAFSKFIDNLYSNQDDFVRKQLFGWMSYEDLYGTGLTLTEDGCFIGYKGCMGTPEAPESIRTGHAIADGVDYNGHIPNKLGSTVEMPRNEVTADPAIACGPGLHVGTHDYAKSWARGVLLTVKVNPRDVVSVPVDCGAQKIRTCRYEVIEVVENAYEEMTYSASETKSSRPVDANIAATISEAVDSGARVKISYVAANGQASIRTISAVELENDLVKAWCENANGPRSFYLSEIRSAEILEDVTDEEDVDATVSDLLADVPAGSELRVVYIDKNGAETDRVVTLIKVGETYFVGRSVESGQVRSFSFSNVQALEYAGDEEACYEISLEDVIAKGVDLEIEYTNAKGVKALRVITPDRIVDAESEEPRLLAYCHTADDFRTFLISSISSVSFVTEDELDEEIAEEIARNGYSDSPPAW